MLARIHFWFTASERTSLVEAIHDALVRIIARCRFPQQRDSRGAGDEAHLGLGRPDLKGPNSLDTSRLLDKGLGSYRQDVLCFKLY